MSDKESTLYKIVDICVACCTTTIDGVPSITREEVLGKCRKENVCLTRMIIAMMIISFGYTRSTVAQLFGCSTKAVANMLEKGHDYIQTSWAFKKADAEATILCDQLKTTM